MLSPFFGLGLREVYVRPLFVGVLVIIAVIVVWRFLESDAGLAMRATGANPRMARAQGVDTRLQTYLGLALSNALLALGEIGIASLRERVCQYVYIPVSAVTFK